MNYTEFASLHEKLKNMRFSGMAAELKRQHTDPNIDQLPADERISRLIMAEDTLRYNKKLNRMLKSSCIRYPEACIDTKIMNEDRGISRAVVDELKSLQWLDKGKNLILTGPCGCGKTYFASALGFCAIQQFKKVYYTRANNLMNELRKAEVECVISKKLKELQEYDLLILDDFGMMDLNNDHCRHLFEVLDCRDGIRSTVFISQYPVSKWYGIFDNATYAEACLDRALHQAYRVEFKGKSLRKRGTD